MEGVSLDQFLAVREAAIKRTGQRGSQATARQAGQQFAQSLGVNGNSGISQSSTTQGQTPSVQKALGHSLGKVLNEVGQAANRYIANTADIEEKVKNNENFVKKVGNFIDIRA